MKMIMVVTDSKRRNLLFVTEDLKAYSLDEALNLVEKGLIEGVHIVKTKIKKAVQKYLRADPNASEKDNLDYMAITPHRSFRAIEDVTDLFQNPGFKQYWQLYTDYLNDVRKKGNEIISIDGLYRTPKRFVVEKVRNHKRYIFPAARKFSIDPYTLGAIVIDEYAQYSAIDILTDDLLLTLRDPSVGIAQITLKTARTLIKKEYYNPNPADPKLSKSRIDSVSGEYLYAYVVKPRHNINFAAARIRYLIDRWENAFDISDRPDLIGTLYSASDSKKKPHDKPKPSDRGKQIQEEFYPLAKQILGRTP
jgi:hypothetical protein